MVTFMNKLGYSKKNACNCFTSTPAEPTISVIREAAVRLQADAVLVFITHSDIYQKVRALAPDEVKAYSTCEAFLLDVRTGLIPFTKIITEDIQTKKQPTDTNMKETLLRAENEAVKKSVSILGDDINEFLAIAPVHAVALEDTVSGEAEIDDPEMNDDSMKDSSDYE